MTVEMRLTDDDAHLLRNGGAPYETRTAAAPPVIGVRNRSRFTSRLSHPPRNLSSMDAGRRLSSAGGEKAACAACQNRVSTNVVRHHSHQRAMVRRSTPNSRDSSDSCVRVPPCTSTEMSNMVTAT